MRPLLHPPRAPHARVRAQRGAAEPGAHLEMYMEEAPLVAAAGARPPPPAASAPPMPALPPPAFIPDYVLPPPPPGPLGGPGGPVRAPKAALDYGLPLQGAPARQGTPSPAPKPSLAALADAGRARPHAAALRAASARGEPQVWQAGSG